MRYYWVFVICIVAACSKPTDDLKGALSQGSDTFQAVLKESKYEVQIIYGRIYNDSIVHETFNVDSSKFFYPASTVKMPVALAAMQRLQENEWSLDAQLTIDSSAHNPRSIVFDSLYKGPITVRNLIKKIFTVSDNQAYNILYGWLGKDYINELNQDLGLSSSRIIHQLSESAFSFTDESNRNTFKTNVVDGDNSAQYLPEFNSFSSDFNPNNQLRGVGYQSNDATLVNEPFDFSVKNFFLLGDLLGCLERVVKPGMYEESDRYAFDPRMYRELEQIMKMRPRDLPTPLDSIKDNYVKFFMFGDSEEATYPDYIEIRNKVGWAYGYLTDIAYIRDYKEEVEFFLAATIHVNDNQIYNDGIYEYEEIGLPFLAELGRLVHAMEVVRKKSER